MVKIDENGNKVNVWTESRMDITTLEIVEVEHVRMLATADDTEHYRSRTTIESDISLRLNQPTLFVYAADDVLKAIEKLVERIADMCDTRSSEDGNEVNIPLAALLRVMVGETEVEGMLLYKSQIPTGILVLLMSCDIASAEQLRDAIFEIFPTVDYIEIEE